MNQYYIEQPGRNPRVYFVRLTENGILGAVAAIVPAVVGTGPPKYRLLTRPYTAPGFEEPNLHPGMVGVEAATLALIRRRVGGWFAVMVFRSDGRPQNDKMRELVERRRESQAPCPFYHTVVTSE